MKNCIFETKFKNPKNPNLVRCKCDGTIRNKNTSCRTCPKRKATFWSKLFRR